MHKNIEKKMSQVSMYVDMKASVRELVIRDEHSGTCAWGPGGGGQK